MHTRKYMIILLAAGLLAVRLPALAYNDDSFDLQYDDEMIVQTLTPQVLEQIWLQQMPPRQAVEKLFLGVNFTAIPGCFNRQLHQLTYHLGILTANRNQIWTPQLVRLCGRLERLIALFTMLEDLPVNTQFPVVLRGVEKPFSIPLTDHMSIPDTTEVPIWRSQCGKKFQAAIVALPHRIMKSVSIQPSVLRNALDPTGPTLPVQLDKVEYFWQDERWQYRLSPAVEQPLNDGMQVYLIRIDLPENMSAGAWIGSIELSSNTQNNAGILNYTLTIEP